MSTTAARLAGFIKAEFSENNGRAYAHVLALIEACKALEERRWLRRDLADDTQTLFGRELTPLRFALPLAPGNKHDCRELARAATEVAHQLASTAPANPAAFLHECFRAMDELIRFDEAFRAGRDAGEDLLPSVLYRAFDDVDAVLGLHYGDEHIAASSTARERLYENSGVGVQTSYQSLLLAFQQLELAKGAHLIDLGSGFGRVGLAAGLWRPDLRCTGYEFVDGRVQMANVAAKRAGIEATIHFVTQDLSDLGFSIPAADLYYLYDPFSESTYRHVMARLREIGHDREIIVVTKADAKAWFRELVDGPEWSTPELLDGGTLSVYRSRPQGKAS